MYILITKTSFLFFSNLHTPKPHTLLIIFDPQHVVGLPFLDELWLVLCNPFIFYPGYQTNHSLWHRYQKKACLFLYPYLSILFTGQKVPACRCCIWPRKLSSSSPTMSINTKNIKLFLIYLNGDKEVKFLLYERSLWFWLWDQEPFIRHMIINI